MNNNIDVTRLASHQIPLCGTVLAHAFFDDPISAYCLPDEDARKRVLPWVFSRLAELGHHYGDIFTTGRTVKGGGIWLRPGQTDIGILRLARVGFLKAPFIFGLRPFNRFMNVMSYLETIHHEKIKGPHWYLFLLGVEPDNQGQGIGGALMAPTLLKADQNRIPCYLETTKEANVPYYEKYGFSVVASGRIPDGGPQFWCMYRNSITSS